MSYILDALRRAEAERERGSVPGLYSPGLPLGGAPAAAPAGRPAQPARTLWLAGGVVLVLLGVALGAWWAGGRAAVPALVAGEPVAAVGPAAADGGRGPSVRAPGAQAGLVADMAAAATAPPLRLPTPPVAAPAAQPAAVPAAVAASPVPAPPDGPARAGAGPAAAPGTAQTGVLQPGSAAGSPGPATASAPLVVPLSALPPELRAAWPPLAIGGSIYSDNPTSRFIMANGQVVREGQTAAPGVVVERIGRSAVVLLWRGLRVEVPV